MESEVGRFLEGHLVDTQRLLRALYDLGLGQGADACVWIDGREMVFGKGDPHRGRGFLRIMPGEAQALIAFPKGHELWDPQGRTRGPPGSQTTMWVRHPSDLDPYVRRLVESAYALEA